MLQTMPGDEEAKAPKAPIDPRVREAVRDVDPSLLDWSLSLSLRERLRASYRATAALARFRHEPEASNQAVIQGFTRDRHRPCHTLGR
jgi:hypothetical protein